ncbi:hypothetical protein BDV93DRAFT_447655, partial [Ceratobasidium sp. AG-I]
GRSFDQITALGGAPKEFAVDRITSHKGKGREAIFKLIWKSGDRTWEPYTSVKHLEALDAYCEVHGVKKVRQLPKGTGEPEGTDEELFSACLNLEGGAYKEASKEGPYIVPDTPRVDYPSDTPHSHRTTAFGSQTDMSQTLSDVRLSQEAFDTIINSYARAQAASNDAVLRAIRTAGDVFGRIQSPSYGRGGKPGGRTHRQCKAKAKERTADPGMPYGREMDQDGADNIDQ